MSPQSLSESTFLILASLTEPRHGYAIMQWVEQEGAGKVRLGPGTLYGALQTLQERGLIAPQGVQEEGNERRKVYVLTRQGQAVLSAEVERLGRLAALGIRVMGGVTR